jgi:hypothetical protein
MPHSGAGSRARRVACYFELRRIPLPRTWVNKGKGEGPGPVGPQPCLLPDSCSVVEEGVYSPQTAVVVTFLQVPGVPLAVHTNSVPSESM